MNASWSCTKSHYSQTNISQKMLYYCAIFVKEFGWRENLFLQSILWIISLGWVAATPTPLSNSGATNEESVTLSPWIYLQFHIRTMSASVIQPSTTTVTRKKKRNPIPLYSFLYILIIRFVFFVCLFFTLGRHVVIYIKHDLLQFVSCQKSPIIPPVLWLPESYNWASTS